MELSLSLLSIVALVVIILVGWSFYVIRRDRLSFLQTLKNKSRLEDGKISREEFARLVYEAILSGEWEP